MSPNGLSPEKQYKGAVSLLERSTGADSALKSENEDSKWWSISQGREDSKHKTKESHSKRFFFLCLCSQSQLIRSSQWPHDDDEVCPCVQSLQSVELRHFAQQPDHIGPPDKVPRDHGNSYRQRCD
jgi:hypothetical protein